MVKQLQESIMKDIESCYFRNLGPMFMNCKLNCERRRNYRSPTWFGGWIIKEEIPQAGSKCEFFVKAEKEQLC